MIIKKVICKLKYNEFHYIFTGVAIIIGFGITTWPLLSQFYPNIEILSTKKTEVNLSRIFPGKTIIIKWRGKPVFIRNRLVSEIKKSKLVKLSNLKDIYARNCNINKNFKALDKNRTLNGRSNWLIMLASCTHLGCVPIDRLGDFGGWYCPCHGTHYDMSGRVRKGPASINLIIPEFKIKNNILYIGNN